MFKTYTIYHVYFMYIDFCVSLANLYDLLVIGAESLTFLKKTENESYEMINKHECSSIICTIRYD